ncbi:MAG: c-type cytochrome [Actinobacteria bacterium]|nr:MAG: c-type cytochrome [Actinomycetota bacterium]
MKERAMRARLVLATVVVGAAITGAACSGAGDTGAEGSRVVRGASPEAGKQQIIRYGCGACHQIPGIKQANGLVAPPLDHFGRRGTIAGHFANTPDNLINWVNDPQGMLPGNDMPNLGVTRDEARNIAAYLESLQ